MTQLEAPTGRRLLFLLPFPPRSDAVHGGARVMGQLLNELAKRHHIALLYLREANELPIEQQLRERCELVEEIARPPIVRSVGRSARLGAALLRGQPMWATDWTVGAYAKRLRALVRMWQPEIIQVEYHIMGQYLPALNTSAAPRILTIYEPGLDVARERVFPHFSFPNALNSVDILAWSWFERAVAGAVQAIIVFTERDRRTIARLAGNTPIIKIPFGVSVPEQSLATHEVTSPNILFFGNFVHPPNSEAAERLAGAILPRLREQFPDVMLYLVGDQPPPEVRRLENNNVVVTGRVPDVGPYLERATLVVVPLRSGGGMRVKVAEALVAGKALVASQLAIEGFDIVDGEHVVLAESDDEFVAVIGELLADPERRARIAASAGAWARAHVGWNRTVAVYEQLYTWLLVHQQTDDRLVANSVQASYSVSPLAKTASNPKVATNISVAIATLHQPVGLARCLDAILAGDVLPAEIIVVDQSKDDSAVALIEQRRMGITPIIYVHQQQRGLSASRNAAVDCASYPIIAVTDDDCVPDAGWVAAIERAFAGPSAPDVVTGRVLPLGPEAPGLYAVSSRTSAVRTVFNTKAKPWMIGTGGNCAMKRTWALRIGRYDERLGAGSPGGAGEDLDMLYRLLCSGARIQYEPEVLVYHERQSHKKRIASRLSYGRGVGACCGLWLRQFDVYAWYILLAWVLLRGRLMLNALRQRRWGAVYEEMLVFRGTGQGLLYGLLVDHRHKRQFLR